MFFPGPFYCCIPIKTGNWQPNVNCVLLMTSQSLQPFAFQIAVYLTLFVIGF